MSPPRRRDGEAALDPRLVRALEHPVRARLLSLLARTHGLSAPEALNHLDRAPKLANLAYNVWVLADLDLIEPAGEPDPHAGRPYKVTIRGRQALTAIGVDPDQEV